MRVVLDASALLAYLRTEPGSKAVDGVLGNSGNQQRELGRGGAEIPFCRRCAFSCCAEQLVALKRREPMRPLARSISPCLHHAGPQPPAPGSQRHIHQNRF